MQGARGDQGSNVRGVAELVQTGNEIRGSNVAVFAVDRSVCRQTAIADQAFQPRFPGPD